MTNRTPTDVIASVEQWASHIITQPNDPMRRDVAAVLAMAEWAEAYNQSRRPWATDEQMERWFKVEREAFRKCKSALSAAGVGGGE